MLPFRCSVPTRDDRGAQQACAVERPCVTGTGHAPLPRSGGEADGAAGRGRGMGDRAGEGCGELSLLEALPGRIQRVMLMVGTHLCRLRVVELDQESVAVTVRERRTCRSVHHARWGRGCMNGVAATSDRPFSGWSSLLHT